MFGWYGPWEFGPWLVFPIVMCGAMLAMMLFMSPGHVGRSGHAGAPHMHEPPTDSALETLRERFASGELTPEEYEEKRKVLLTV
jgi:uncharacterized membrane protein